MKKHLIILTYFFLLIFAACKKDARNGENNSVTAVSDFTSPNTKNLNTDKIISIMRSPETVSISQIAKIVGTDAGKITINEDYTSYRPSERRLFYSWPNGDVEKITDLEGEEFQIEGHNSLGIAGIKKMTEEEFKDRFESPDYNRRKIEEMAEDDKISADIVLAEAEYLAEFEKIQKFEKIKGIDQPAYWETPVNTLHIYADGTSFAITANLKDTGKSKKAAMEFLSLLLKD